MSSEQLCYYSYLSKGAPLSSTLVTMMKQLAIIPPQLTASYYVGSFHSELTNAYAFLIWLKLSKFALSDFPGSGWSWVTQSFEPRNMPTTQCSIPTAIRLVFSESTRRWYNASTVKEQHHLFPTQHLSPYKLSLRFGSLSTTYYEGLDDKITIILNLAMMSSDKRHFSQKFYGLLLLVLPPQRRITRSLSTQPFPLEVIPGTTGHVMSRLPTRPPKGLPLSKTWTT